MSSNNFFIRKAKLGDERGIHDAHMYSIMNVCIKDHGYEEVKGWGQRDFDQEKWSKSIQNNYVWVIEERDTSAVKGVACLILNLDKKSAEVAALYFHPDAIGLGFAKDMMNRMIDMCKSKAIQTISLDSSLTALGFYEKMGFNKIGPLVKEEINGSMVSGYPMKMIISQ